ncbi:hypothetical protein GGX14DRAFT_209998 [Mycena pura]|uniref:Uncharacterized protein n=1 Tax=Mycena pura TaxID=153505 RepID=A0AAD6UU78_9AGAR|nr:hypothetical protein GGX14DRAFT_209998 [Mycena pura]
MVFTPVPTTAIVSLTTTAIVALGDVCARPAPRCSPSGSAELHPSCHTRSPRRVRIPSATSRPPELPDDLLTRRPLHTPPMSRTRTAHAAPYVHAAALSHVLRDEGLVLRRTSVTYSSRAHALGILMHPPTSSIASSSTLELQRLAGAAAVDIAADVRARVCLMGIDSRIRPARLESASRVACASGDADRVRRWSLG